MKTITTFSTYYVSPVLRPKCPPDTGPAYFHGRTPWLCLSQLSSPPEAKQVRLIVTSRAHSGRNWRSIWLRDSVFAAMWGPSASECSRLLYRSLALALSSAFNLDSHPRRFYARLIP